MDLVSAATRTHAEDLAVQRKLVLGAPYEWPVQARGGRLLPIDPTWFALRTTARLTTWTGRGLLYALSTPREVSTFTRLMAAPSARLHTKHAGAGNLVRRQTHAFGCVLHYKKGLRILTKNTSAADFSTSEEPGIFAKMHKAGVDTDRILSWASAVWKASRHIHGLRDERRQQAHDWHMEQLRTDTRERIKASREHLRTHPIETWSTIDAQGKRTNYSA